MTLADLVEAFGDPHEVIKTDGPLPAKTGRPDFADDDPAVMAAIARCATWRSAQALDSRSMVPGWVHPSRCGWCDDPLPELIRACEWSNWRQERVVERRYVWVVDDTEVVRAGPVGDYLNPAYAKFAALPLHEQRYRVEAAVEASRS